MSIDTHKNIARRFLRCFETGVDIRTFYKANYIHHNPAFYPNLESGLENFIAALRHEGGGLSNVSLSIDHLVAEGDLVVARFTVTGTHDGVFQDLAPTGRHITFSATDIYRFEDGLIAEGWATIDWMAILQQIGPDT